MLLLDGGSVVLLAGCTHKQRNKGAFLKRWIIIAASICVLLGGVAVVISHLSPPTPPIPFPPPLPPYNQFIATTGVIEPSTQNTWIGTSVSDIVADVYVKEGDIVDEGAPLFRLSSFVLHAELEQAEATYEVAVANYQKLLDLPRPESIPPMKATLKQAEVRYDNYLTQYELVEKLKDPRSVSQDEYNQRKFNALFAKYQIEEAQSNLNLLLSGTWIRDLEISRAQKKEALACVNVAKQKLECSTIIAPCHGTVLIVNIRKGEFAQASADAQLMLFGSLDPLFIRVAIIEEEVWRWVKGAPGVAYIRGNRHLSTPISYVRVQPYLQPKISLSGDTIEQVNTRVLNTIYKIENPDLPFYPGEMLDVFLDVTPPQQEGST